MRALLVFTLCSTATVHVTFAPAARAEEQAPPPLDRPAEDPTPVQADGDEPEPVPVETPDDADEDQTDDDDDGNDEGRDRDDERADPKSALPPADGKGSSSGGFGGPACWGATTVCGALGVLPAFGTLLGTGAFIAGAGAGALTGGAGAACLGITYGALLGAPSLLVLGPCASGGALVGGVLVAALDDRSPWPVAAGASPGVILGLLGTAGAAWGLIELANASGDFTLPATLLALSAGAAFAAGPVAIAGISIADGLAGASSGASGAIQVKDDGDGVVTATWRGRATPMAY
jgi:hypothetical protein